MRARDLIEYYPCLYHVTATENWDLIRQRGILSASALMELFEVDGDRRERLTRQRRSESEVLEHAEHGRAIVRDNKCLTEPRLKGCLEDGLKPADWHAILDRRVFFWATCERLGSFLKPYSNSDQLIIVVPTELLVKNHLDRIEVSTINSGAIRFNHHIRGLSTFVALSDFDFDAERKRLHKSRRKVVAEVTVIDAVERLTEIACTAIRVRPSGSTEVMWQRERAACAGSSSECCPSERRHACVTERLQRYLRASSANSTTGTQPTASMLPSVATTNRACPPLGRRQS